MGLSLYLLNEVDRYPELVSYKKKFFIGKRVKIVGTFVRILPRYNGFNRMFLSRVDMKTEDDIEFDR